MRISDFIPRILPAKFLGSGLLSLAIKFAGAVITYAMIVILARVMTVEQYGVFAFGLNLAIISAALSGFGFQTGILRYWPKYVATNNPAAARGVVSLGYLYLAVGGWIMIGLAVSGAILVAIIFGKYQIVEFFVISVLGLIISLGDYSTGLLRAQGSVLVSMLPREVFWRMFTIFGVGVGLAAGYAISGLFALSICGLVLIVLTFWQLIVIRRNITKQLPPSASTSDIAELRPSLIPLWISGIVIALLQQFDVVVVGSLLGSAEAGSYFAAQKTAGLLSLVLIAAGLVAAPSMSGLYNAGKMEELQRLCRGMAAVIVAITGAGFLFMALAGKFLLGLFDAHYIAAYPILLIVALGTMIDAISGPNAYLMQMTNYEKPYLKIMCICYGLVLVAQFILVPMWGATGAAIASTGGIVSWNLWAIYVLRKDAGLDPSLLSLIWPPHRHRRDRLAAELRP